MECQERSCIPIVGQCVLVEGRKQRILKDCVVLWYDVDQKGFIWYLQNRSRFYDGTKSTLYMTDAVCGEVSFYEPYNIFSNHFDCGGYGLVKDTFHDISMTTAVTVTPSYPLKVFWQPTYTPPPPHDTTGYGVGINPSNNGINLETESALFHEALHGSTGLMDGDLGGLFHVPDAIDHSYKLSMYIRDNVLKYCPSFR